MSPVDSRQRIDKIKPSTSNYPALTSHEEKVFVVVKTYPRPSKSYKEIVCTAGITENGQWIRLYPVDYRYMPYERWYKKYQWVSIRIEKNEKDFRIDSYRPDVSSLQPLGEPIGTQRQWSERKKLLIPTLKYHSIEEIEDAYSIDKISLAMFQPKRIEEFVIEADTAEWSSSHQNVLSQLRLFGDQPKPLKKIPYKFSYKFICDDQRCKGHTQIIVDWEIFMLYRQITQNYPYSMDVVLQKIRDKWLTEMWSDRRDSYLIVGTQYPYPTFIVLGVFWPPKVVK